MSTWQDALKEIEANLAEGETSTDPDVVGTALSNVRMRLLKVRHETGGKVATAEAMRARGDGQGSQELEQEAVAMRALLPPLQDRHDAARRRLSELTRDGEGGRV